MKFVTQTLLVTNALSAAAFAPPRPQHKHNNPSFQQQLLPDPSTLESSTLLTSDVVDSFMAGVGSLALLGSIGFGVTTAVKNEGWEYDYKAGNKEAAAKYGDAADLAIIEVSPEEVEDMAKAQEVTEAQKEFFGKEDEVATEAQKSFFGKIKSPKPAPKPAPAPAPAPAAPVVKAQSAKAPKISDTVLKATEKAKNEVKKKGVEETKQKMNSKSTPATTDTPPPPPPPNAVLETTKEVTPKKEKGATRKLAKGATLIAAAGVVAMARNVVKAWLGRGLL